jgi:long-chain acyl-CoA synthetase
MTIDAAPEANDFATACRLLGARTPDRPALRYYGRDSDFGDLDRLSNQVAQGLIAAGLGKGDRIAFYGRNSDDFFILFFGAAKAGIVTVPVNWRLTPAEAGGIVTDARARLAFVEAGFGAPVADGVRLIATAAPDRLDSAFRDWLAAFPDTDPQTEIDPEDIAVQLYTSGTTGPPKGAMLPHRCFFAPRAARRAAGIAWDEWIDGDATLVAMPVGHIGGARLGLMTVAAGACAVVAAEFDAAAMLDFVARDHVTRMFIVPTALRTLLAHPRTAATDFTRLRTIFYGAAPMPPDLLAEATATLGCGFVQQFGMTETTGTFVALDADDHRAGDPARLRSVGRAMPGVALRIVGADGADLPVGQTGEIVTRSPANMAGYWNAPEATAATIDADGWLRTGDAAYLDADGYVFLQDRIKDMIITGGENVYPADVEVVLGQHPAIADVAVFGTPDAKWGEAVTAAVVLRPGESLDTAALLGWARSRLAPFKLPKAVHVVDALPRNANGKLLKRDLRARFAGAA